jgi:hypothetical protein
MEGFVIGMAVALAITLNHAWRDSRSRPCHDHITTMSRPCHDHVTTLSRPYHELTMEGALTDGAV